MRDKQISNILKASLGYYSKHHGANWDGGVVASNALFEIEQATDSKDIPQGAIVGPARALRKIIEKLERGECEDVSMSWSVGEEDITLPWDTVRRVKSDGNHTVILTFKEKS